MSDETPFERGLDAALQKAYREINELKAEAKRREEVWLDRLQAADRRVDHVFKHFADISSRLLDPPILIVRDIDVGRLSIEPGGVITAGKPGTIIHADEWPKTERTVIEVSRDIYFRDFLRSLWKRLTGRRAA